MKSIITSVSPYLCEKIASGDCRMLVKKSAPKEVPFKDYIYCTKGDDLWLNLGASISLKSEAPWAVRVNKKVIGEFICDKVIRTCGWRLRGKTGRCAKRTAAEEEFPRLACLTIDEIVEYSGSENLEVAGWHISDLKIYGKPKELSEFKTPPCDKPEKACGNCKWLVKINTPDVYECECYVEDGRPITRPPSSWQYVEELRNE